MKLAVNYSHPAAELLRAGKIQVDCFKCPAWPDLVATVQEQYPAYVHFPLRVGLGISDAIDTETNQPADWDKVEALLSQTGTPLVNLHLAPSTRDYPDIPVDTVDPMHVEMLTERAIKDVNGVVKRFGAGRVVVENDHASRGRHLRPAFLPEVICRVIEETGCDLLLDVSHARLAAHCLGVDVRQYVEALPLDHTREIHVTGVQRFEGRWVDLAHRIGIDPHIVQHFTGHLVDHLPITDEGWSFVEWVLAQARNGAWGQPHVVTFEYGGVSGLFEAVTDVKVLAEQIPRLYVLVNGNPLEAQRVYSKGN